MIKKTVMTTLALFLLLVQTVGAEGTDSVESLLKGKLDFVFSTLQRTDIQIDKKKALIVENISPIFDFSLMGKLTLGKKNWSGLTKKQRHTFITTFTDVMKSSYSEKLSLYTNEEIKILPVQQTKPKKAIIPTELISKETRYAMSYKFYKSKQGWKIYDIELQGVSLVKTYQSQFNQVLAEGGFDELISKLSHIKV
ncbi:phospholipid-binding protein MlaC [Desulfoluna sp.]|uniref:MlaC/ttg2D family ABC transporter substrate-binding protein n=1 Tax=Desulfoluna sp. TaxID=2045199 RepID=UPI002614AEC6|nr:ABC transporter substrate-binding protein [Desulfoluna sp.]